jgi:FtsH-binding integral membrane protein
MDYALRPDFAYRAPADARATFLRRTYGHLAGAVLAFTALEMLLFSSGAAEEIVRSLFFGSNVSMLFLLVGFIGAGWVAQYWARSAQSPGLQYLGLGLYVVVEVLIFLPLLYVAVRYSDPSVLPTAAIMTLSLFAGLTTAAFATRKDMSFLGPIIMIGSFVALGFIVAGILFQFQLGVFFSLAMVGLASLAILYSTSNVLHHYRTDQHVAAALDLFAAVALLFYYILLALIQLNNRR